MGEQNRDPKLHPAVPNIYLLDLNSIISPGVSESVPLHLLFNDVDQQASQNALPLFPSKPTSTTTIQNRESAINSKSDPANLSYAEIPHGIVNYELDLKTLPNEKSTLKSKQSISVSSHVETRCLKKKKALKNVMKHSSKNLQEIIKYKENNKIINYTHIPDTAAPVRAVAVLPKVLRIRSNNCIYPRRLLSPRVRFGPVEGVKYKIFPAEADELIFEAAVTRKPIFLLKSDEESVKQINVSDKEKSNWLGLLPLGTESTANVWLYEEDGELYGITTMSIASRTPLALGYSKKYAEEHKLPPGQPILDLQASAEKPTWWCYECQRDLGSAILLLRHTNSNHKDKRHSRKIYRCSYCLRRFTKLFSLRRHVSIICSKKPVEPITNVPEIEPIRQESDLCITQNSEDHRTPSDDSFQNFTNALDFSTNLFDPDRISNLDLSGSSKSEVDFNPYTASLKFDNIENNEDYTKFCKGIKFKINKGGKSINKELNVVTCPHCKQTMTKVKKRRHLKYCPGRRWNCHCGKIFKNKDDFATHIILNHKTAKQDKQESNEMDKKSLPYKCDNCKLKFKRRGMLVNHLWRVHNTTSAAVPLERRVRHYPCAVCFKIYRTAAKRDRHVEVHHPGPCVRAAPIDGEKRVCQPARCSACPREYATHSKLLQHIRAQHPELAAPTKVEAKPPMEPTAKEELPVRRESTQDFY